MTVVGLYSPSGMNAEIVGKVSRGDGLTDGELYSALVFYEGMARDLLLLGPHFHLAWAECQKVATALGQFHKARLREADHERSS